MTTTGWVKLHRKILDWEWYTDSKSVHLLIHLILQANHQERKWHGITVLPGQVITSLDRISKETGISLQSIRTTINRLKSTCEITHQSTSLYSLITICKWETYQSQESEINTPINTPSNNQSTSDQQAINKRLTTNKNVEKVKNERSKRNKGNLGIHDDAVEGIEWPVLISERLRVKLLAFFDNRKQAKKYMTPGSVKQNIEHVIDWLLKFSEDEICQAIESAIGGNWQGLYEPKPRPSFPGTQVTTAKPVQPSEMIGYRPPETPGPSKAETAAALEELQRKFCGGVKQEVNDDEHN
jgi:hypothetical protein